MEPAFAVFLLMNNYFHDVATAMLLASGIALWIVLRKAEGLESGGIRPFVLRIYAGIRKIVIISLAWIAFSAIPRILTFSGFEWKNAEAKRHLAGLLSKHVVAFLILMAGLFFWISLSRGMKDFRDGQ